MMMLMMMMEETGETEEGAIFHGISSEYSCDLNSLSDSRTVGLSDCRTAKQPNS